MKPHGTLEAFIPWRGYPSLSSASPPRTRGGEAVRDSLPRGGFAIREYREARKLAGIVRLCTSPLQRAWDMSSFTGVGQLSNSGASHGKTES
jgi:hypothetical protein